MSLKTFKQDPTARLDYPIDWSAYLEAGDSIVSATARADTPGDGFTVEDPVTLQDDTTIVWITTAGATAGTYTVSVHIVTVAGREDERSIKIQVAEQ
ncbi:hypothetical protein SEA_NAIRB_24 [Mycobacterium phage Nairb]|uniref:Minor tail protein n=5 Tax=Bernalvirus bernal13 TaxID=1982102 RepID=A0A2P1JRV0_9CAUD|nr:minor tail protein [Mycobacterium phage Bernal13]AIT13437.1 hypothetical protein PBI_RONRAYGUN_24 [Mycobacterium phage RonRayGun]ASJ79105.1 hypothetical protein SEA_ZENTIME222_24 [Mycobacterium phage ZenTime222]AVO21812.1 hypothetical protein SEA_NAIRB_24 [Mycobacterium phage Nairb]QBP28869.1 minor tail protein [Mycobacterium phage Ibrahim]QHB47430.1 minor tail protein [Mycobacterium phage Whitty]